MSEKIRLCDLRVGMKVDYYNRTAVDTFTIVSILHRNNDVILGTAGGKNQNYFFNNDQMKTPLFTLVKEKRMERKTFYQHIYLNSIGITYHTFSQHDWEDLTKIEEFLASDKLLKTIKLLDEMVEVE